MVMPSKSSSYYQHTLSGVGEKRDLPRRKFFADIYILPLDGRQPPLWVVSEDICHRGMLIRSRTLFPVETLLLLKIYTVQGLLSITAKVVHSIEGIGFGCEFLDIDDNRYDLLSHLVGLSNAAPYFSCPRH